MSLRLAPVQRPKWLLYSCLAKRPNPYHTEILHMTLRTVCSSNYQIQSPLCLSQSWLRTRDDGLATESTSTHQKNLAPISQGGTPSGKEQQYPLQMTCAAMKAPILGLGNSSAVISIQPPIGSKPSLGLLRQCRRSRSGIPNPRIAFVPLSAA